MPLKIDEIKTNNDLLGSSCFKKLQLFGLDQITSQHTIGLEHECFSAIDRRKIENEYFIRIANNINPGVKKPLQVFYISRMFEEYSVPYRAIFIDSNESSSKAVYIQKLIKHEKYKPSLKGCSTAWLEIGRVVRKIHDKDIQSNKLKEVANISIDPKIALEKISELKSVVNPICKFILKLFKTEIEKNLGLLSNFKNEKGIIHGDLKPENAIYNPDGTLYKLIDYDKSGVCNKGYELGSILSLRGKKCLTKFLLGYEEDSNNRSNLYKTAVVFSFLFGINDLYENQKNGNSLKATNSALRLARIIICNKFNAGFKDHVSDLSFFLSEYLRCRGEDLWRRLTR